MKLTTNPLQVLKSSCAGFLSLHLIVGILMLPLLFSLRVWTPPVSSLMIYRALFSGDKILPKQNVSLGKLPKWLPKMFIYLEDHRFYTHHGVDFEAIKTAFERNKTAGRLAYGGSTITQQLTRTLFLTPHKNYFRKYIEVLLSLELDLILSKNRIMELYLNEIEWGRGVFGIGRAALVNYKRPAEKLGLDQYCRLAAIIPGPRSYTVRSLERHAGLMQRYEFLVRVFSQSLTGTMSHLIMRSYY